MRIALMMVIAAFCLILASAQPQQIGGDYGKSWLNKFGNKNVVRDDLDGLWSWGTTPKGQLLINGTLQPEGITTVYDPSFLDNQSPIILNRTAGSISSSYLPLDLYSAYFTDDPWFLAQTAGRPVILRERV